MTVSVFLVTRSHGPGWDDSRKLEEQRKWREHAEFMEGLARTASLSWEVFCSTLSMRCWSCARRARRMSTHGSQAIHGYARKSCEPQAFGNGRYGLGHSMDMIPKEHTSYRPWLDDVGWLTGVFLTSLCVPITEIRGYWNEAKEREQFMTQLRLADTRVILNVLDCGGFLHRLDGRRSPVSGDALHSSCISESRPRGCRNALDRARDESADPILRAQVKQGGTPVL